MDVADQFQEIRIFFADDRFVSILEKVTTTFVAFVEGNSVPGHETAHDFAEWGGAGAQEEVEMVWNQGPCVALHLGFFEDDGESFQERLTVLVIEEDVSSFNSPGHDVLEEAWGVKSWLACHFVFFDKIFRIFLFAFSIS